MKKNLVFLLILVCIIAIFTACNKNLNENYEDNTINDVNSENLVEKNISGNSVEKSVMGNINSKDKNLSGENDTIKDSVGTNEIKNDEEIQSISGESSNEIVKIEPISGLYSSLSNKTNAWGFVRKPEGTQPEFHGPYTKVLDEYEGIYVGNKDKKVIYLTFDEGYENGYTATILDTLKDKGVTATFFVTLPYVKQNPDLIQRMIDENQIIR